MTLAHLQSIAVDFAKHGESVDGKLFHDFDKLLDGWPDFFEKTHQETRKSTSVLGKLYRDISNDQVLTKLIEQDYKTAIRADYELDFRLLAQTKNSQMMHSYLMEVYTEIVRPMAHRLRQLMLEMNFGSEAEIFASDLRFKMFDDTPDYNSYKPVVPMDHEDAI